VIDLHSHIVPGVDDGAKDAEEAAAMLRMAAADGITDIVATPHASPGYAYDRRAVEDLVDGLRRDCPPEITIHCGCDFHLSLENVRDAAKNPWRYVIDETAYMLVEFPEFLTLAAMDGILSDLIATGIVPIITHPERHPILRKEPQLLNTWVYRDCLIQITAQSILGDFGRSAKKSASELLNSGLAHLVASDAHDTRRRPPLLSEAQRQVRRRYGAGFADALFTTNARAVLEGNRVETTTRPARRVLGFHY
jgi:protein-tyrosine phosphatase